MAVSWKKQDDSTYFAEIGGTLLLAVVLDRLGTAGWKVQVGRRTLRDKIQNHEDAMKVAVAFARKVLDQAAMDLDQLAATMTEQTEQGDG